MIVYDGIIYATILAVLCVGLTLTYKVTRVPNFAHASFAILGMYMALILSKGYGIDIYASLPLAFAVSGGTSFILYYAVIRVLQKRNSSLLALMFVTLAFDIMMIGVLNIVADSVQNEFLITSRGFTLRSMDHAVFGVPLILPVSLAGISLLAFGLYCLLYGTRFGIQMRAAIENQSLARTLGVNTVKVFSVSWYLSGGLAGIAGALMALWFQGEPDLANVMLPSIFAGSIVGGINSIYGAILGGLLVGFAEIFGTTALADALGYWIVQYRPAIPFIAMIATLLVLPGGLAQLGAAIGRRRR